jgi:hypothetical protein
MSDTTEGWELVLIADWNTMTARAEAAERERAEMAQVIAGRDATIARLENEIERLRAALEAANYYIDRLENFTQRRRVRDMGEAMEAWRNARAALGGKDE